MITSTSAPAGGDSPWISPSAPMPRRRSHSSMARSPSTFRSRPFTSSRMTRKSLARPWCLVSCTGSVSQEGVDRGEGILPAVEPGHVRVTAEPPFLAAGEASGAGHRLLDGLVEGALPTQVLADLAVAEGLGRRRREAARLDLDGGDLVDEPGDELSLVPVDDPLVELGAFEPQADDREPHGRVRQHP